MKKLRYSKANLLSALHDQLLSAVPALRPAVNERGENEPVMAVEAWGDEIVLSVPDGTDEAAVAAVVAAHDRAALEAALVQGEAEAAALRAQIISLAQSAVGVRVDLLTAAQVRALFAVVLHKAGGVANDLTVRPLADWAR